MSFFLPKKDEDKLKYYPGDERVKQMRCEGRKRCEFEGEKENILRRECERRTRASRHSFPPSLSPSLSPFSLLPMIPTSTRVKVSRKDIQEVQGVNHSGRKKVEKLRRRLRRKEDEHPVE